MAVKNQLVAIPGSNRPPVPLAKRVGPADPKQRIRVSVYARQNPHSPADMTAAIRQLDHELPAKRRYLNNEQFNAVYGADPHELAEISDWAAANKLKVLDQSVPMRRVLVEGAIADVNKAFGVQLNEYRHPKTGRYRGRVKERDEIWIRRRGLRGEQNSE